MFNSWLKHPTDDTTCSYSKSEYLFEFRTVPVFCLRYIRPDISHLKLTLKIARRHVADCLSKIWELRRFRNASQNETAHLWVTGPNSDTGFRNSAILPFCHSAILPFCLSAIKWFSILLSAIMPFLNYGIRCNYDIHNILFCRNTRLARRHQVK